MTTGTGCSVINLAYVDRMSGGNKTIRRQMLDVLVQELKKGIPQINTALRRGDCDQLERACHSFKSTLMYTGNQAMQDANLRLLSMSRQGTLKVRQAQRDINTLRRTSKFVLRALQQEIRS